MRMHEAGREIDALRREWGGRLLILGHYYQRASVLRHADAIGDSLELARASAKSTAERIVFCGVRFMAESADILTGADRAVYMPVTSAGCPMADMAGAAEVEQAWGALQAGGGGWLPVVYVNSSAEIKALCGRWGGSTCTSSNAPRAFQWVLGQGKRVFFLPDEHLGRNTACDLGIPEAEVALYDPRRGEGGLSAESLERARVVVWKGFCIVHAAFTREQIAQVRERLPGARIIVHPETPLEVTRLADAHGSTSQIIRYVESAPDGATVVVGTEVNLIDRLAGLHQGRVTVKALRPSVCANMAKTNVHNLLSLLQGWPEECRVRVPARVAEDARQALSRMLAL
jgi:quinolinate synthase